MFIDCGSGSAWLGGLKWIFKLVIKIIGSLIVLHVFGLLVHRGSGKVEVGGLNFEIIIERFVGSFALVTLH